MDEPKQVRTNCRFCGYLCGIVATVEAGRVTAVEPDPSRFPYDAAIQRGCRRWKMIVEFLDHPQRINFPQKRVGERGSGKWQQVSWTEALDDIAARLQVLKDRIGPEMLATSIGGPHATYWPLHRFMNLFGSPNNIGIGQICWNPGVWIQTLTYGWPVENELDPKNTACTVLWGTNPAESDNNLFWRSILEYRQTGRPLIVIDPRRTKTAAQATHWLAIRPGTDPYLALALLHVIVRDQLWDRQFVDEWCHGFAALTEHVARYTPEEVEPITEIEAGTIARVARLYAAQSPATIITGRGIDQLGRNTAATHQAVAILRAVTGNVDVPGGCHVGEMPEFAAEVDLELSDELPESQRAKCLDPGLLLQSYAGYARVRHVTERFERRLPMRYLTSAHPNLVWRAMLTDEPYPVRALIVDGSNPLLTLADSRLTCRALKRLDLLVALEYFQTPTAMLADYVLPAAGVLERPLFQTHAGIANIAYGGDPAVKPYYERRPDYDFWRELGRRLGQADRWPWETLQQALAETLGPAGVSWSEFCTGGLYYRPSPYRKHEQIMPDTGLKRGFGTKSGKVELFSQILDDVGADPMPEPQNAPPVSPEFPLQLLTGARKQPFYASSYHQFRALEAVHPQPWVEMSAETATRFGLADGCPVIVETERGSARFITKIAEIRSNVVSVEYGWWFPEMRAGAPDMGGAWISNANLLTSADVETSDPLIGTWILNGLPCRVRAGPALPGGQITEQTNDP